MAIRVLLLTQWFEPEPTFKGLVFARELMRQGFEVEVLTGFPNYPGGKLYPGYKVKLLQREVIHGVEITRVPLYPSHGRSGIGRVMNYLSFSAAASVYGLFGAKRPDVIYAYHPPLTVGITAALIRIFRRVPVVYDVQDMWPDTLNATGMFSNRTGLKIVSRICDWVYRTADHLVVLSPGFKRILISRGVPEEKIDIIYNWCDENALAKVDVNISADFPGSESFRILFAGNIGKAQALESVIEAAQILKTRGENIIFVFLGGGLEVDNLKELAVRQQLYNVRFLPRVPMSEVGSYLNSADALLVHLKKDELFTITIPSKTQAYMAAGKPILMAVDGDAADLIRQSGCGQVAESENPQDIANAALALQSLSADERKSMAGKGSAYYKENLSLSVGTSHFGSIFRTLSFAKRKP
ncbi:glycosyltransferase family 4 protein [Pseudomonas fulva]|uniref:glycosyltransferase family 4 protein n=1 Tax=Pseudomonas fulva TaxID=47880 RepID=UPI00201DB6CF|nr:glycosyltransferase family 4 protein [Pseudomonas fulva]UQY34403.1 glycosyltransferase family 4 protein [Pseudomonas fulva]